mgnify:CR=1 FL=1
MLLGGWRLKKKYILDAGVLPLYFAGHKEAKKYIDEIYMGKAEAYMCEVNVAEFLYNYAKVFGWNSAQIKHNLIRSSPINIISPNENLTLKAAKTKLKHYNILSLADSYLIALANQLKATIITTDKDIEEANEAPTILLAF